MYDTDIAQRMFVARTRAVRNGVEVCEKPKGIWSSACLTRMKDGCKLFLMAGDCR